MNIMLSNETELFMFQVLLTMLNEAHLPKYCKVYIFCYQKVFSLVLSNDLFLRPVYETTILIVKDFISSHPK